jgi:hypothetical protein
MASRGPRGRTWGRLFLPTEIDALAMSHPDRGPLNVALVWIRDFLSHGHRDIGRANSVCPFIPAALAKETLWLATSEAVDPIDVEQVMVGLANSFETTIPTFGPDAQFAAYVVVFPGVPLEYAPSSIDAVQNRLKPSFVERGLMIGEFHQGNRTPAVSPGATPGFFPNRAPISMLAIRSAVSGDQKFLRFDGLTASERLRLMRGYLRGVVRTTGNPRAREYAVTFLSICELQLELAETSD